MTDTDHPDWHPPLNEDGKNLISVCLFEAVKKIQDGIPNAFLDHESEIMKTMHDAILCVSGAKRQRRNRARLEYNKKMVQSESVSTPDFMANLVAQLAKAQQAPPQENAKRSNSPSKN